MTNECIGAGVFWGKRRRRRRRPDGRTGGGRADRQMKRASRSPSPFIILAFASSCQQRKCVKSTHRQAGKTGQVESTHTLHACKKRQLFELLSLSLFSFSSQYCNRIGNSGARMTHHDRSTPKMAKDNTNYKSRRVQKRFFL